MCVYVCVYIYRLPWWLSGKESSCNAGDAGDSGLIPGSGKSTGEGNNKPLQHSCLENPMNSMKRQKDVTLKDEFPSQ